MNFSGENSLRKIWEDIQCKFELQRKYVEQLDQQKMTDTWFNYDTFRSFFHEPLASLPFEKEASDQIIFHYFELYLKMYKNYNSIHSIQQDDWIVNRTRMQFEKIVHLQESRLSSIQRSDTIEHIKDEIVTKSDRFMKGDSYLFVRISFNNMCHRKMVDEQQWTSRKENV